MENGAVDFLCITHIWFQADSSIKSDRQGVATTYYVSYCIVKCFYYFVHPCVDAGESNFAVQS